MSQSRLLIVVSCWMEEASGLPPFSVLEDVSHQRHVLCRQGLSSQVCRVVAGAPQRSNSSVGRNRKFDVLERLHHIMQFFAINWLIFLAHLFRDGLAWYTIGIYNSATSAFWKHIIMVRQQIVLLLLIQYITLICSTLLLGNILIPGMLNDYHHCGRVGLASSFTILKLVWKTTTPLALVIAKHCSDLTLLHFDNQHLFKHSSG